MRRMFMALLVGLALAAGLLTAPTPASAAGSRPTSVHCDDGPGSAAMCTTVHIKVNSRGKDVVTRVDFEIVNASGLAYGVRDLRWRIYAGGKVKYIRTVNVPKGSVKSIYPSIQVGGKAYWAAQGKYDRKFPRRDTTLIACWWTRQAGLNYSPC